MAILINEWLPNPVGSDAAGEFIELFNDGDSAAALAGWVLKTEKGKKFFLDGHNIPAKGYLVLKHSETKLTLRNGDGGLLLYDHTGKAVDRAKFFGSAPEGKSFSRASYSVGGAEHLAFVDPTPGAKNRAISNAVAVQKHPEGVALNSHLSGQEFFVMMAGTAALLAGLIIYVIKANEDISKLFFKRD